MTKINTYLYWILYVYYTIFLGFMFLVAGGFEPPVSCSKLHYNRRSDCDCASLRDDCVYRMGLGALPAELSNQFKGKIIWSSQALRNSNFY